MTQRSEQQIKVSHGLSVEAVEELSRLKREPTWMLERRLEAWRVYMDTPMPTRTDQQWKRTDLSGLNLESLSPFAPEKEFDGDFSQIPEDVRNLIAEGDSAGNLVHLNSRSAYEAVRDEIGNSGVIFTSMDSAVREHPDLVQRYFMSECVPPTYGVFAALHGALWTGGSFIYVPKGVEVKLPLHSISRNSAASLATFGHVLIVADRESKVILVDEYISPTQEEQSLHCGVVEIHALDGSRVDYVALQDWGRHYYDISVQRAMVHRDATVKMTMVGFGGKLSRSAPEAIMVGQGSSAQMYGLYFGDGDQRFDYHTLQDHAAPNTTSQLLYKGALRDQSQAVYEGLVRVRKGAIRTNASQTNRNLLLSPNSKADSEPILEIEAADIDRCSHGATVGKVDEGLLFYLTSRGLSREEATKLIVAGFFDPVIEAIPVEAIRDRLRGVLERKLETVG